MSPRALVEIGGVWLAVAASWLWFGPKQFAYAWQAVGVKRVWIVVGIYLFAILYQVFIFGWLIPAGIGLYKIVKNCGT